MRTEFIIGDTLCVVRLGFTSNDKIAPVSEKIVQTYHYSRDQFEDAQSKSSMQSFFSKDGDVCFDCPYSMGSGAELKGCYTHKMMQYAGMVSQLRSIATKHTGMVNCPASKEAGYKSTCSKCTLCSGTTGKGSKSVYIFNHS